MASAYRVSGAMSISSPHVRTPSSLLIEKLRKNSRSRNCSQRFRAGRRRTPARSGSHPDRRQKQRRAAFGDPFRGGLSFRAASQGGRSGPLLPLWPIRSTDNFIHHGLGEPVHSVVHFKVCLVEFRWSPANRPPPITWSCPILEMWWEARNSADRRWSAPPSHRGLGEHAGERRYPVLRDRICAARALSHVVRRDPPSWAVSSGSWIDSPFAARIPIPSDQRTFSSMNWARGNVKPRSAFCSALI